MQEKGERKGEAKAFVLRTLRNTEIRRSHICVIKRAAHIFSSKLHTHLGGKGTCSRSLDNRFVNCTDEALSGRF